MGRPGWQELKTFARTALDSRSVRTACLLNAERPGWAEVCLPGFSGSFRFRTGTSDVKLLRSLLTQGIPPEYEPPVPLQPQTILDIGANIGTVTAALVQLYPKARVFAFEPLPENFELLAHNVAQFPNVTAVPYGLGAQTELRTYTRSDNPRNFGGGGFHGGKSDPTRCVEGLQVVAVPEALDRLGIDRVDLLKIDTEGAEHEILTSFPEPVLREATLIIGELHGKPGDGDLLEYLDQWFAVQVTARRGKPKWFKGVRRQSRGGVPVRV
jgi:FkbM family methyltransferase